LGADNYWKRPYPAPLLLAATFGTEILGTLIAVYGIFFTPIGGECALWMWLYALLWFVVDNAAKMFTYRLLRTLEGRQDSGDTVVYAQQVTP